MVHSVSDEVTILPVLEVRVVGRDAALRNQLMHTGAGASVEVATDDERNLGSGRVL